MNPNPHNMVKLPPWSFSMIEQFEQCPRKAYHKYILKEKGPETEAQRKGNEFDKAVEARLLSGTPLPAEWAQYDQYAESLVRMRGDECVLYSQLKMGIGPDFQARQFFDKDVWGRGALDVALIRKRGLPGSAPGEGCKAIITDWKTGKNSENKAYSNHGLQLKIFALLLFTHFPGVDQVTAFNLWLKTNEIGKPYVFKRSDKEQLWREVLPKVMAMEKAFAKMAWPEQPGPLCGYCEVKACQFNKT